MTPTTPTTQGGVLPPPLPARSPLHAVRAVVRAIACMPALVRAGFALLAIGIVADVVYHVINGVESHDHGSTALAIHLTVAAGMVVTMLGLIALGVRSLRQPIRKEET